MSDHLHDVTMELSGSVVTLRADMLALSRIEESFGCTWQTAFARFATGMRVIETCEVIRCLLLTDDEAKRPSASTVLKGLSDLKKFGEATDKIAETMQRAMPQTDGVGEGEGGGNSGENPPSP